MSKWQYTRGLHELGNSSYAYLQPDGERIIVNVATIYRELSGDQKPSDVVSLFSQMAALYGASKDWSI